MLRPPSGRVRRKRGAARAAGQIRRGSRTSIVSLVGMEIQTAIADMLIERERAEVSLHRLRFTAANAAYARQIRERSARVHDALIDSHVLQQRALHCARSEGPSRAICWILASLSQHSRQTLRFRHVCHGGAYICVAFAR